MVAAGKALHEMTLHPAVVSPEAGAVSAEKCALTELSFVFLSPLPSENAARCYGRLVYAILRLRAPSPSYRDVETSPTDDPSLPFRFPRHETAVFPVVLLHSSSLSSQWSHSHESLKFRVDGLPVAPGTACGL